jgi:tetratricopeptide (TPR) repeat protein
MISRLLNTLDARIKTARDPVENACLRGEKAALLARQGRLDAARAELRDLRSRFDGRPHAAVSAWASLAEGLVAYFEDLNASARDKFKRAHALSQFFKSPAIEALSAAWLAQTDYLNSDFESMTRHLVASFQIAPVDLHSARSRASLVVAEAYHWAERLDLALPWYGLARQHATAEGDDASLSALMHNMAWLRTAQARRHSVFGEPDVVQTRHARLGAESIDRFDALIGTASLGSLVPVLRSQVHILDGEFDQALDILALHMDSARKQGMDRMACVMYSDAAWCKVQIGDINGARSDAGLALACVTDDTDIDDMAMTHSRLAQIYTAIGETDESKAHRALADSAWRAHMNRQAQLLDLLIPAIGAPR